jgi:hypothetical protein
MGDFFLPPVATRIHGQRALITGKTMTVPQLGVTPSPVEKRLIWAVAG